MNLGGSRWSLGIGWQGFSIGTPPLLLSFDGPNWNKDEYGWWLTFFTIGILTSKQDTSVYIPMIERHSGRLNIYPAQILTDRLRQDEEALGEWRRY